MAAAIIMDTEPGLRTARTLIRGLWMRKFELYQWQKNAYQHIENRSAVLSAPTGSGKTLVEYMWAGLLDENGNTRMPESGRIIFTAPIKALSNERYMDLRRMGMDVGIETGDFKRNEGARVICCTQEIYTMKYAGVAGQRLIIDEFHYIFTDPDRARTYIDGIRATHPDTPILVMSATLGGVGHVGRYLSDICGREFTVHESKKRATKLIFTPKHPVKMGKIHDALVFCSLRRALRQWPRTSQVSGLISRRRRKTDSWSWQRFSTCRRSRRRC